MIFPDWVNESIEQPILLSELRNFCSTIAYLKHFAIEKRDQTANSILLGDEPPKFTVPASVARLAQSDDDLANAIKLRPFNLEGIFHRPPDQRYFEDLAIFATAMHPILADRVDRLDQEIRRDTDLRDAVLCLLTGGEQNVFRCLLRNKPGVSYDTLAELKGTWEQESPDDEAIRKRLYRMNTKLSSCRCEIRYGKSFISRRAKLINHKKV